MYVLVTIDDLVVIPSDVREVYESITSEDFELRRKTVSWVGQCLTFLDFYYGCAAVDIVLKLVHTKKGCRISKEELLDCVGLYEERFAIIDDYIMAIGLADNNKYKQLIRNQGENKSYYIPTRDEIEHFYKTHFQLPDSYHKDMAQFIKKFCDIPGEEQDITDLMQRIIYDNGSMQDVMDMLDENGIYFDAQKDLEKFVPLFNDLWNNTRMLENKGHTPNEIMREIPRVQKSTNRFPVIVPGSSHAAEILQEGKKEIEEMGFEIDFDSNAKEINVLTLDTKGNITKSGTKKVYPNDPCPCGSGKKYKKCCGR
jgi:hypothetical protein